ncbi:hypothetical protein MTR67_022016, partial [Solanum verrucosum]
MEVEMGACATNSLLELRTFAEKLGESITLSLETDTTGAKVLMNELEGWNRDGTKRYKRRERELSVDLPNISTITRQEREAQYGKQPLCTDSGERREQQCILFIALPNLSTITRLGAHQINLEFE